MTDITELEGRIAQALDRISQGVDQLGKATPAPASTSGASPRELIEELEVERATNERLVGSREKLTVQLERQDVKMARLTDRLSELDAENVRLQNVIAALHDSNAALRAANSEATGAPDMIQSALNAELTELKAARAADLAQMDEILATLTPIAKEA